MGLFGRRSPVPAKPLEFGFFDDRAWRRFVEEVERSVRRERLDVERHEPGAMVVRGMGTLGLLNVAQLCHASPAARWPGILDEHFAFMREALSTPAALRADQLRVRLLPDDYGPPEAIGGVVLMRPFAESVNAALAFDLPTTVQMATAESLATIGLDAGDAWEAAWRLTRERERVDQHDVIEVDGAVLHSLSGESFYVASLVPFLTDHVDGIGEAGAIVTMPRRHTILVHVIRDLSVTQAIHPLVANTRRLFAEGPGAVSAHLSWWRGGELRWLPVQVDDEAVSFFPPDDFVEMVGALPPS